MKRVAHGEPEIKPLIPAVPVSRKTPWAIPPGSCSFRRAHDRFRHLPASTFRSPPSEVRVQSRGLRALTEKVLSEFSHSPFFVSPCLTARLHPDARIYLYEQKEFANISPDDITSVIKFIITVVYRFKG